MLRAPKARWLRTLLVGRLRGASEARTGEERVARLRRLLRAAPYDPVMLAARLLVTCSVLAVHTAAQGDVLHYKFDARGGDRVLNFESGPGTAPREGRIASSQPAAVWSPGRFGGGLAGLARMPAMHARVETGWAPAVSGDFTCAFYMRLGGTATPPIDCDLLGVPVAGGFRMHVGTSVLMAESVEASNTVYATNANVAQLAALGWLHVAFVLDTNRSTATYYIDGMRDASFSIGGGAAIAGPDFWVGQHLATRRGSIYDFDEVRILQRAATPLEIQAWVQDSGASDVAFGTGCGGALASMNGPPSLGNGSYAMAAGSLPNAVGLLALGGSRVAFNGIPLPLDLGLVLRSLRGCSWYTSSDLIFPFALDQQGGGAFALPVPGSQFLLYQPLYVQALFTDLASEQSTNAVALSIGR